MEESAELRHFVSQLEQIKINKENYVLSLEKKVSEKLKQVQDKLYGEIEQNFDNELALMCTLKKVEDRIKCLKTEVDIKEQIIMKNICKAIEDADLLIKSATVSETDVIGSKFLSQQENAKKKEECRNQLREDLIQCEEMKKKRIKLEEQRQKMIDYAAEQQLILDDLRTDLKMEEKRKTYLETKRVQLGLIQEQENFQKAKEELTDLREEHDCITKLNQEEDLLETRRIQRQEAEAKVLQERNEQLRYKEQLERNQTDRDQEYLKMLIELQGEEGKLETTRLEARRRQEMRHQVAAKQILEERRTRRKYLIDKFKHLEREEKLLQETKRELMQEEEKKLLMAYLPHLGPFLSTSILQKLSSL